LRKICHLATIAQLCRAIELSHTELYLRS